MRRRPPSPPSSSKPKRTRRVTAEPAAGPPVPEGPYFGVVGIEGDHVLASRGSKDAYGPGRVERWDTRSGELVRTFPHGRWVRSLSVAPDGSVLAADDGGALRLWDPEGGVLLHEVVDPAYVGPAVLLDGGVALHGVDSSLHLVRLEDGTRLGTLEGHEGCVLHLARLPGGDRVLSSAEDGMTLLWDVPARRCLRRFHRLRRTLPLAEIKRRSFGPPPLHDEAVVVGCVLGDGRRAVTCSGEGALRSWDLQTGDLLAEASCGPNWLSALAAAPSGDRVVVGAWDGRLSRWDARPGEAPVLLGEHTGTVAGAAFLDEGRVVSCSHDETLRIWQLSDGRCARVIGRARDAPGWPPNEAMW